MRFDAPSVAPLPPVPLPHQIAWQRRELLIFVHFGINTFTDHEWGDGRAPASLFNPEKLDANQWAAAAKAAGAKGMVLTAKHHDGFCLWPSKYSNYSVAASPWKGGRGDVVREFVDACRRYDLSPGLYLSPWDRHEPSYGDSPVYNRFYINQLTELLTEYGELGEIWFDGACGEGPNGKRQQYDWPAFFETCARLQPNAVTFGDGGTTVRWIGNERGYAGDPNWALVDSTHTRHPGDAGADRPTDARAKKLAMAHELHHGNPNGDVWRAGEVDVSIRPDWFYHDRDDEHVRSVSNLVELYFRSVGRNAVLLLNVPPDRQGLFHPIDVERLAAFNRRISQIFSSDVTEGSTVQRTADGIELTFPSPQRFNVLRLGEAIEYGQRVARYRVRYRDTAGQWAWLIDGDTIGYRKLDRFDTVEATALQLKVTHGRGDAVITDLSAFLM